MEKILVMNKMCRTCMRTIRDHEPAVSLNNSEVRDKLLLCYPEMRFDNVVDPRMCTTCTAALSLSFRFRGMCSEVDKTISTCIQNKVPDGGVINVNKEELLAVSQRTYNEIWADSNFIIAEEVEIGSTESFEQLLKSDLSSNWDDLIVSSRIEIDPEVVQRATSGYVENVDSNTDTKENLSTTPIVFKTSPKVNPKRIVPVKCEKEDPENSTPIKVVVETAPAVDFIDKIAIPVVSRETTNTKIYPTGSSNTNGYRNKPRKRSKKGKPKSSFVHTTGEDDLLHELHTITTVLEPGLKGMTATELFEVYSAEDKLMEKIELQRTTQNNANQTKIISNVKEAAETSTELTVESIQNSPETRKLKNVAQLPVTPPQPAQKLTETVKPIKNSPEIQTLRNVAQLPVTPLQPAKKLTEAVKPIENLPETLKLRNVAQLPVTPAQLTKKVTEAVKTIKNSPETQKLRSVAQLAVTPPQPAQKLAEAVKPIKNSPETRKLRNVAQLPVTPPQPTKKLTEAVKPIENSPETRKFKNVPQLPVTPAQPTKKLTEVSNNVKTKAAVKMTVDLPEPKLAISTKANDHLLPNVSPTVRKNEGRSNNVGVTIPKIASIKQEITETVVQKSEAPKLLRNRSPKKDQSRHVPKESVTVQAQLKNVSDNPKKAPKIEFVNKEKIPKRSPKQVVAQIGLLHNVKETSEIYATEIAKQTNKTKSNKKPVLTSPQNTQPSKNDENKNKIELKKEMILPRLNSNVIIQFQKGTPVESLQKPVENKISDIQSEPIDKKEKNKLEPQIAKSKLKSEIPKVYTNTKLIKEAENSKIEKLEPKQQTKKVNEKPKNINVNVKNPTSTLHSSKVSKIKVENEPKPQIKPKAPARKSSEKAPVKTPVKVVNAVANAIEKLLQTPEYQALLQLQTNSKGTLVKKSEVVTQTLQELESIVKKDTEPKMSTRQQRSAKSKSSEYDYKSVPPKKRPRVHKNLFSLEAEIDDVEMQNEDSTDNDKDENIHITSASISSPKKECSTSHSTVATSQTTINVTNAIKHNVYKVEVSIEQQSSPKAARKKRGKKRVSYAIRAIKRRKQIKEAKLRGKIFYKRKEIDGRTLKRKQTPQTCDQCGKVFKYVSHLNVHKRCHIFYKSFQCELCGKEFSLQRYLLIHTMLHFSAGDHQCTICNRYFSSCHVLKKHQRTHTGERPYICELCDRSFTQRINLETHTRAHTGVRNFICYICNAAFGQKIHLVGHVRIHTGERPFACDLCPKTYSKNNILRCHKMLHAKKPYMCTSCNALFRSQESLQRHKKKYRDEIKEECSGRIYSCGICSRYFMSRYSKERHLKVHVKDIMN